MMCSASSGERFSQYVFSSTVCATTSSFLFTSRTGVEDFQGYREEIRFVVPLHLAHRLMSVYDIRQCYLYRTEVASAAKQNWVVYFKAYLQLAVVC
ncbi:hypothetical protein OESDEN_24449 [Oesophagostomum dentatum]|uniref:Uncharacterized protein n=1 Tax=Oesophagostomum dentatum TaxID=61180 RepID=A0A0B1RXJ5_OESDE|nr:hypothetical protein OESDEN_24449 [Oesophagostomum dentatum]